MSNKQSLSVVIPTFNARHLLEKHLPNVDLILQKNDELIIVDDASTDDTLEWLNKQHSRFTKKGVTLKVVKHTNNQRFAAAVNSGVDAATHSWVLLLNNDVSPLTTSFRTDLFSWTSDKTLFAVGCAEVNSRQKDTPIHGRGTGRFERGLIQHWFDPHQNQHDTLWTSGGSMFFDREKFQKIGGMDTLFYPAYEEDRDLSYRALKYGWKLIFDPRIIVLHQHETTNSDVFGQRKMAVISWKNQFLLVWKNISSPLLLLQHFFWLPYHLSISHWRSKGVVWPGFLQAVRQIPQLMASRKEAARYWKLQDEELVYRFSRPLPDSLQK